ncbi:MAG: AAA family ATPase [Prevotella sp.]|nr:AAA family ATPase [Prevotella sp.]
MRKYRLIDDFQKPTRKTIWKHLDAMAVNYAVYSTHLTELAPVLTDTSLYVYADSDSVVIVQLHYHKNATDKILSGEDAYWKLTEAVMTTQMILDKYYSDMKVSGLLLTEEEYSESLIHNSIWSETGVMVIDGVKGMKRRKIRVNEDNDLPGKPVVDDITVLFGRKEEKENPQEKEEKKENDDFERMLNSLLTDDSSPSSENPSTDKGDNNDDDGDANGNDNNGDTNVCDTRSGESIDNMTFPDGNVEQNDNNSVKVEILRPIANPRRELDKLVGCADIKQRMDDLVALTSFNQMMRKNFPRNRQHHISLHSLFLGRPGTGKTTVCKIYGSLLHQSGALSKGHVVVCDRGTFIGTLWGDEERSIRQVVEMAKGGVLMIDEAYLLNSKNDHDPGRLVIQLLMNILADETQRDIAVVLCGYREPMMRLLNTNPGLLSRFPNKFEFNDFTVDELLEITQCRVRDYHYSFTDEAWTKYRTTLTQAYEVRDPETWGNARYITNLLDRIYMQHAARCVRQQPEDKFQLLTLTPDDIVPIETPRQKAKFGF